MPSGSQERHNPDAKADKIYPLATKNLVMIIMAKRCLSTLPTHVVSGDAAGDHGDGVEIHMCNLGRVNYS